MLEAFCTSWMFCDFHVNFFAIQFAEKNILQNNVALKFICLYCLFGFGVFCLFFKLSAASQWTILSVFLYLYCICQTSSNGNY